MKEEKKSQLSHEGSGADEKKVDEDGFLIVQPADDTTSVVESLAPPTKKELRFEEKMKKKKKRKMTIEEKEKEVKKSKQRLRSNSKRRYGHVVGFDRYQISTKLAIFWAFLAIIIIPLELFLERLITSLEIPMIENLQKNLGENDTIQTFNEIPLYLVKPWASLFFMMLLYLTTDSLLAFKSALITSFGYYFLTVLKLLYKDGRPFWVSKEIIGYRCRFDFGGPSYHLYTLVTFWTYNVVMY